MNFIGFRVGNKRQFIVILGVIAIFVQYQHLYLPARLEK